MSSGSVFATADEDDALVEQTDNAAEEGQPDPPQDPDWRPWSDGPAGE